MTRWLTPEEEQMWRGWITATRKLYGQLGHEMQANNGISMGDYEILLRLSEGPDKRLRMSELADQTLASRSRLSHQVDRMAKSGLVRREANPEDGRGLFAVLTEEGQAKLDEAAPSYVDGVRRTVYDVLTKRELATVGTIARKVLANLDAEKAAAKENGRARR